MTHNRYGRIAICTAVVLLCAMGPSRSQSVLPVATGSQGSDEQKALTEETTEFGEGFVISLGGKLYDDVWVTTGTTPPAGSHPAYPKTLPAIGSASYRCPACHGWDYMGKDGHLGTSAPGVPFRSLRHLAGEDPQKFPS